MSTISLQTGVYPIDGLQVPTNLGIGVQDRMSHIEGVDADTVINQHIGCATHQVVTRKDEINLPASEISSQLQFLDRSAIKSVKIGMLGSSEIVEEVETFLQNVVDKRCHVVMNLNNANQWNGDVLQATRDSVLPSCSVLIITYDIANLLCNNNQQSMQEVAYALLNMGPKVVVVQDKEGQRYVALNDDGEGSKMKCVQLPGHCVSPCTDDFSTAVAAYLAHNSLPLSIAICYGHFYSIIKELNHSSIPRMLTLTFTQELWSSVDAIYNRMLNLPFLNEMLNSTLKKGIYDYYIVQDYLFFIARGHMLGNLVNQCTNNEEVRQFLNTQYDKNQKYVQTILSDNNLPPCDEKTEEKMPACENYTNFMLKLDQCHEDSLWLQGLIALVPCSLVYAKIGDWMIASGIIPTVKRYADFIDQYRDQAKRDRLIGFLELTDRAVNNCSYKQRQKLKEIFQKVCEYENAFLEDAYQYGMQSNGMAIDN